MILNSAGLSGGLQNLVSMNLKNEALNIKPSHPEFFFFLIAIKPKEYVSETENVEMLMIKIIEL